MHPAGICSPLIHVASETNMDSIIYDQRASEEAAVHDDRRFFFSHTILVAVVREATKTLP
jgi:hypothetical protein